MKRLILSLLLLTAVSASAQETYSIAILNPAHVPKFAVGRQLANQGV